MIRMIGRRLVIPRGDSGSFSLPALYKASSGDIAIFGIFNPLTHENVLTKIIEFTSPALTFTFSPSDTINLEPRKYNWDITIYKDPAYDEEGQLIGAAEVDSYYSAYNKLPICEITETVLDMNKERWKTRDRISTITNAQKNTYNNMSMVYPWENEQIYQTAGNLYKVLLDNGCELSEDDFLTKFALIFSTGSIISSTIEDFPEIGDPQNLYLDKNSGILYFFKILEGEVDEEILQQEGVKFSKAVKENSEDFIYYAYIPVRAKSIF